jgi:EAL domain-containing protein (putative c-di-GMP-specific phosphodiesterase class I)/CheY-like chemotaxis protein
MSVAMLRDSGGRRARVLVVDNEPAVLAMLMRVLERGGYEPVPADGLIAARAVLDRGGLDAVLTDLRLSDGTGLDILDAVRRADPSLPVMFLTGATDVDSAVRALEGGAMRYLTKPVRPAELVEAVRSACQFRDRAKHRAYSGEWPSMRDVAEDDRRFDAALEQLYMVFQPIVTWSRRRVIGVEALMRSHHPEIGRPDKLLEAAERLGRMPELGRAVRARVAARIPTLPSGIDIYVNLHASELLDDDLLSAEAPLSRFAPRVVLEITERAALDGLGDALGRIAKVRTLGYRIAVDDLGAGYASLSMLARVQPDVIKIDMSLVHGVRRDPTRQMVIRSLTHLGAQLGVLTIVEGIETGDDLASVVHAGADHVQGYLFARPAVEPIPPDFGAIGAQFAGDRWAQRTGPVPVTPDDSPLRRRQDVARTLCHDAKQPLAQLAALAQRLDNAGDEVRAVAEQMLEKVAQVDALLGAIADVVDAPPPPPPAAPVADPPPVDETPQN